MYQWLVTILVLSSLAGMGFFLKKSDTIGLFASSSHMSATSTEDTLFPKQMVGVYDCASQTVCKDQRMIIISPGGEIRLITSFNDGVEVLEEVGTWKSNGTGSIQLVITGTNGTWYKQPYVITMRQNSSYNLVGDVGGTTYKDWGRPLFVKQDTVQ